jgi:hypothetical protein
MRIAATAVNCFFSDKPGGTNSNAHILRLIRILLIFAIDGGWGCLAKRYNNIVLPKLHFYTVIRL